MVIFFFSLSLVNSWCDDDGRFLQCEFSYHGKSFRVCCIYCLNRNPARDQFLDDLHPKIDPSVPTVLAGDFNTVFNSSLDRRGSVPTDSSREGSSSLQGFFDSCCVVDMWRYLHPATAGFTWTRWDGSRTARIDLFGVPYVRVSSISSCNFLPCPFSDHCAVLLSVSVPDVVPPGPGLGNFNTSILKKVDFWSEWRACTLRFPSLAKWWEVGKSHIKGLTIRYCCSK